MHVQEMLESHPQPPTAHRDTLARCIAECFDCAEACVACADACLAEPRVDTLRRCIRLNHDCADICTAAGRILARRTEEPFALKGRQLQLAAEATGQCADECARHAREHEHCKVCEAACRACERSCRELLSSEYSMTCSEP